MMCTLSFRLFTAFQRGISGYGTQAWPNGASEDGLDVSCLSHAAHVNMLNCYQHLRMFEE